MAVYLDGKVLPETDNLACEIEDSLKQENLVINSVWVNDTEMINTPLEEVINNSTEKQVIKIETSPALQFSMEAIESAIEYIPSLNKGLLALRESSLEGKVDQAKLMIEQALEGLQWVVITIQAAAAQSQHLQAKSMAEEELTNIGGIFKELQVSIEEEDLTLTCDLFEYEIAPFLEKMLSIAEMIYEDYDGSIN